MRIEVINTGTELLLGKVINTHAAFFGDELFKLGLRITRQTTIPDGEDIHRALEEAFPRCEVILVTGGLGPTSDDITRETVAGLLGLALHKDDAVWEFIRQFFLKRGREPNSWNERQAMVPEGAEVLHNPNGTAPGLFVPAIEGKSPHLFLMPGPPRELRPMFRDQVIPRLRKLSAAPILPWRNFKIYGVGESNIAEVIEPRIQDVENLEYGYCCRLGEVDVRLIGTETAIETASEVLREEFSEDIVTESETPIEQVLIERLTEAGQTIATAESCTGGLIASTLTDVSGSSAVFHRGFITYANQAKTDLLGVPEAMLAEYGAVSEPVARAMVEGCLENSHADHAIAVTGIAGPTGGSEAKPVGTVYIAVTSRGGETVVRHECFTSDRISFKQRTTRAALDLLRRRLCGFV
ncbi:MAG: competence/damage-inducible protein A [Verrucomicrobiae bacterium]|nr:competence/damage-inducible protein A [Verrucomicrobiae bacterium]